MGPFVKLDLSFEALKLPRNVTKPSVKRNGTSLPEIHLEKIEIDLNTLKLS